MPLAAAIGRRRALVAAAALLLPAAALGAAPGARADASASLSKYEPMEALKDKDYGKSRMT